MSRAATRLKALERRRPAAQEFVIVYQDIEQPGRWLGKPREGQAEAAHTEQQLTSGVNVVKFCHNCQTEMAYTEQQLAALPASTTVIKIRYVDWRE